MKLYRARRFQSIASQEFAWLRGYYEMSGTVDARAYINAPERRVDADPPEAEADATSNWTPTALLPPYFCIPTGHALHEGNLGQITFGRLCEFCIQGIVKRLNWRPSYEKLPSQSVSPSSPR